jgi:hypothetical protein
MFNFDTSGNATVIVRASQLTNLLGLNYQENDIVAIFNNVDYEFEFNYDGNKEVTRGSKTLLNFNTMSPKCIILKPQALTSSVFMFLAAEKVTDENIFVPIVEQIRTDSSGAVFLNNIPANNQPLFIKNTDRENVTGFTVSYETGQVTGLANTTNYIAFYYISRPVISGFKMNKTELPYFKMEVIGSLNINGQSKEMLIKIPRISLNIATMLEFQSQSIASTSLDFTILNGDAEVIYY